ncbi:hypothetical protein LV716_13305 [Flagellimonas sp. HMM57]|uniref:hypothetical protein n=1 Tax=unclassified Flagellimonas TaxID=2644544 RepID=UPI0013D63E8C|nr:MULTISPECIES: hypothetical protein [unclassified Flagellimonas]UII75230.1 hypothetical protein LV716_13305 [Flagellimonas sp. HMM57]
MWFRIVSYIKFLLNSTNQHGVHSPFVFNYVTKCLYASKKLSNKKSQNVLLKSIGYFEFEKIAISDMHDVSGQVQKLYPKSRSNTKSVDILYTEKLSQEKLKEMLVQGKLHNNSLILINSIHKNPQKKQCWEKLITLPNITVSIDMFHVGALFIRKEQEKEHFTIRI